MDDPRERKAEPASHSRYDIEIAEIHLIGQDNRYNRYKRSLVPGGGDISRCSRNATDSILSRYRSAKIRGQFHVHSFAEKRERETDRLLALRDFRVCRLV